MFDYFTINADNFIFFIKKRYNAPMDKNNGENKFPKNLWIIVLAGFLIAGLIVGIYFWLYKTTANPNHFVFDDVLDCEIFRDNVVYDEAIQKDCIQIQMRLKNIFDKQAQKQKIINQLKEQGIDAEAPDPEEDSGITYSEEIDELQNSSFTCLAEHTNIEAVQSNRNISEKYLHENSDLNKDALNTPIAPGQETIITLKYVIENTDDIFLYFSGKTDIGENLVVSLKTRGICSFNSTWAKNSEVAQKQQTQTVEITGVKISVGGEWYIDKQAKVNVKLKNTRNDGTLDIEYSSSQDAVQSTKETAGWFNPAPEISQIEIAGRTYQFMQPNENMFVLCTDSISAKSIKITGNNVDLVNAMSVIESLQFL